MSAAAPPPGRSAGLPIVLAGSTDEQFRAAYGARMRRALRAPATDRAYESDRVVFEQWCAARDLVALPASEQVVIGYLLYHGDPSVPRAAGDRLLRPVTLARRVAGLKAWHAAEGARWPQYGEGENLIARTLDFIARAQKAGSSRPRALSLGKLDAAARALPATALGIRNKAMLLLGFYGALRRSELVALDAADVVFDDEGDDGMVVSLRTSKTDQRGRGRQIPVNYQGTDTCPVQALKQWLVVRGPEPGPLFTNTSGTRNGDRMARLSPATVSRVVKSALVAIGEDGAVYAAHSLRSGFVTTAARRGVPARLIRQQTGHASYEMLDRYVHATADLGDNATRHLRGY
ncbi:site-specific integrase [Lolliginicoccus levis]|uniref:site-specific integrase n=1 Tax=Lolliginicoccus levis TaxID=2919542 RepID=UPI00241EB6A5|nr:site-specific integrase [Lolliginicoccus levis]